MHFNVNRISYNVSKRRKRKRTPFFFRTYETKIGLDITCSSTEYHICATASFSRALKNTRNEKKNCICSSKYLLNTLFLIRVPLCSFFAKIAPTYTHTTPRTVIVYTLTHNEKYLRVLSSLILVVVARLHTQRHVE